MIGVLQHRLQELGWSLGRNVQIDVRWSGGDPGRLPSRAAELIALKPDVILGVSTPVVAALRHVTETVPIVFVNANDPVRFGFVQSLARPGGNITGFISWGSTIGGKWLELLTEIVPGSRSCRSNIQSTDLYRSANSIHRGRRARASRQTYIACISGRH